MLFVWLLATLVLVWLMQAVYVIITVFVGRACGVIVEEASVGAGPFGLRCSLHGEQLTWHLGLIPISGSVGFDTAESYEKELAEYERARRGASKSTPIVEGIPTIADFEVAESEVLSPVEQEVLAEEQQPPQPPPGSFQAATPAQKAIISLAGTVAAIAFGFTVMLIPVLFGASRLVPSLNDQTDVSPTSVGGLIETSDPTTIASQLDLVTELGIQAFQKYFLFDPLSGWGGPIGASVTCAAAGANSWLTWCTCAGALAALLAAMNLLPLPSCGAGLALIALAEYPLGHRFRNGKIMTMIFYVSLFVLTAFVLRMLVADAIWLWHLAF